MANRTSSLREAARQAAWVLKEIGRELRVARILAGLTQADVARRLGTSRSTVSRVENGLIAGIKMADLARHAAAVGLRLWVKLFPRGRRILDAPQLALLARFRARLSPTWRVELEVPMPIPGDLRAADALISAVGCRCMVEVITRLADFQAQDRAAHVKQRDLGADRVILVIGGTTTNRRCLREVATAIAAISDRKLHHREPAHLDDWQQLDRLRTPHHGRGGDVGDAGVDVPGWRTGLATGSARSSPLTCGNAKYK